MSNEIDFRINRGDKHVCSVTYQNTTFKEFFKDAKSGDILGVDVLDKMYTTDFGSSAVKAKLVPVLVKYIKNGYNVSLNFA